MVVEFDDAAQDTEHGPPGPKQGGAGQEDRP